MKKKVILLLSLICLLSSCSNYKSLSFDLVASNHLEIEAQRCEHGNIINLDYTDTTFIIRRYETYLNDIEQYKYYSSTKDLIESLKVYEEDYFNKNSLIFYTFTLDDNHKYSQASLNSVYLESSNIHLSFSLNYLNDKYDKDYVNRYMGFVELNGFNESINSISSNYNIYK